MQPVETFGLAKPRGAQPLAQHVRPVGRGGRGNRLAFEQAHEGIGRLAGGHDVAARRQAAHVERHLGRHVEKVEAAETLEQGQEEEAVGKVVVHGKRILDKNQ